MSRVLDSVLEDLNAALRSYFPGPEFRYQAQFSLQHLGYMIQVLHYGAGRQISQLIDEEPAAKLPRATFVDNVLGDLAMRFHGDLAACGHFDRILLADQRPDPTCHPLGYLPRDYDERADRELTDGLISLAGFELGGRLAPVLGNQFYLVDRARGAAHPIASALLRKGSDYWKQILANFVSARNSP